MTDTYLSIVASGLAFAVFYLQRQIRAIRMNDLHELPCILATLQRIETQQAAAFARIIERLERERS